MSDERAFDTIVIGGGSGGVACATALTQGGQRRVALIERERVGGECAFWACVPSKVLLRSEQALADCARVPGSRRAGDPKPDFASAAAWRTSMVDGYDDAHHAAELAEAGVTLLRGAARIAGPGAIELDSKRYEGKDIVIATGSADRIPKIDGIELVPYWTSREATAATELPKRLLVLGGGAVGVELGQMFARYGCAVTLIEGGPHVLPEESETLAALLAAALGRDGIAIVTGAQVGSVAASAGAVTLRLKDGREFEAEKLLVATGRTPRTKDLGLESVGIEPSESGCITIDDTCKAADGIYAIGDVTGKAMFTHAAKYQARVAAATILGKTARASYDAVPRCTFTDPEAASVGTNVEEARKRGIDAVSANVMFDEITRPSIYFEGGAKGAVELIGDRTRKAVIGGWIVSPMASEMIGFVSVAIRTGASFDALLDVIQPYPTFSEAFYVALDRLARI